MIWLSHNKYTEAYIAEKYAKLYSTSRKRIKNMVYTATTAVFCMGAIQLGYLYNQWGRSVTPNGCYGLCSQTLLRPEFLAS
jgi:hypothetical protein